jgi:hypothetical protein
VPTTTAKGYQYPLETDSVTSYPGIQQPTVILLDARPGVSVVTTTARNAYAGTDLWDGRIIWNTTTNQLEKYDLGTTSWISAVSFTPASTVAALIFGGAGTVGALAAYARADHVHPVPSIAAYALLASPNFTGSPTVPTATPLTNNTQAASTGYADAGILVEKGRAQGVEATNAAAITALAAATIPKNNINAVLTSAIEVVNLYFAALGGTYNVYVSSGPTIVTTLGQATANFVFNVASTSGAALNTLMAIGQSITLEIDVPMGATAYVCTAINVDGVVPVSVIWQGGTPPAVGFANSWNIYTIRITKTAANSWFVMASLTQFG